MKKYSISLLLVLAPFMCGFTQQISTGHASVINSFEGPILSGIYDTDKPMLPTYPLQDNNVWKYLFTMRHANPNNNHQFQLSSGFGEDDRVFFRKIASLSLEEKTTAIWHEFATRGSNTFKGVQTIEGKELIVKNRADDDVTAESTAVTLLNRGKNGAEYSWKMYTAAIGGGNGISPNAYEIWEYPTNKHTSDNRQRFVILSSQDASSFNPFILNSSGQALIGYKYVTSTNNDLSINGNVGIGTTDSKGDKLAVAGTIRAQEVKIENTNWPDYVFSPSYQLQSLSDVERYIQENKHLPDIPSEQEVKEEGISVGEMNAKLLQKIEEMTLYMIQMQKEIDELKKSK